MDAFDLLGETATADKDLFVFTSTRLPSSSKEIDDFFRDKEKEFMEVFISKKKDGVRFLHKQIFASLPSEVIYSSKGKSFQLRLELSAEDHVYQPLYSISQKYNNGEWLTRYRPSWLNKSILIFNQILRSKQKNGYVHPNAREKEYIQYPLQETTEHLLELLRNIPN